MIDLIVVLRNFLQTQAKTYIKNGSKQKSMS